MDKKICFFIFALLFSMSSFAEESLSDFAGRINQMTGQAYQQIQTLQEQQRRAAQEQQRQVIQAAVACVQGNDSACVALGVNPNDPCRPYILNQQNLYICRVQQQQQQQQMNQDNRGSGNSFYQRYLDSQMRTKDSLRKRNRSINDADRSRKENNTYINSDGLERYGAPE